LAFFQSTGTGAKYYFVGFAITPLAMTSTLERLTRLLGNANDFKANTLCAPLRQTPFIERGGRAY